MPDWYWEKKELHKTPSMEKGLDFDSETKLRQDGVRFLIELGKALNLSHNTMATGSVYYHRFYMFHTFQDFPKLPVATCCLFLAGKCEETPKKCRDIIRTIRQLTSDTQFETFGVDPDEEIMALERVLLQTIHFDLQVDHPYAFIIKYAKTLRGDKNKIQKVVQMAWTFVNDSLCTTLCLLWEPEIIAIAVMYLAAKLSKFDVKDWQNRTSAHVNWWDQFAEHLVAGDLEEICHQVLDLYNPPQLANLATPISQTNGKTAAAKTPAKQAQPKVEQQQQAQSQQPSRSKARTPPMPPLNAPPHVARARTPPLPPINGAIRPPPPPVIASIPPLPPGPSGYPPPGLPPAQYYYPPNYPPHMIPPHYPPGYAYPVPPGPVQTFYPSLPPPPRPPHESFPPPGHPPPPNYQGNVRY